jgi:hypothetical protein
LTYQPCDDVREIKLKTASLTACANKQKIMLHGQHWRSFVDTDEEIIARLEHAVRTGEPLPPEDTDVPEGGFYYARSDDRPLCAIAVIQKREGEFHAINCHPLPMSLVKNELEIFSAEPSIDPESGLDGEGFVKAITREGTEVSFACPAFGMFQDRMNRHPRFLFGLSATAYTLQKMEEEISITEGQFFEHAKKNQLEDNPEFDPSSITSIPISLATMRCYFPRGEEGDFEFQSRVEEVEEFESLGIKGRVLKLNLLSEGSSPLRISIFAGKNALGDYVPKVGDLVGGVAWMLGVPLEPVEIEKPWMDSVEASENQASRDAMMEGDAFMFSNRHLPLSWQIVGGGFVAAGWEIVYSGTGLFRIHFPAFDFSRGDKTVRVFVRSSIQGFCDAPEWPEFVDLIEEHSIAQKIECLRITVILTPCGAKHFDVKVEGLGDFAEMVQMVAGVGKPEFSLPVEIGEEPVTPVFVETEAAEKLALGINTRDLSEFSKIMVEDFDFESQAVEKSLKGRESFLSYMGSLLGDWNEQDISPRCRLAKVVLDGVERTAALLYPKGKNAPNNGAFFNGRDRFVSSLLVLPPDQFDILKVEDTQ